MTPPKQLEEPTPRLTVQSMKPFLVVFLLAASLVGQTEAPTTSASGIPIDQANMQKARVLINQAIEALGGQAYLNIQDMSQEGRGYTFHHGDSTSAGIQFWRFVKFPDKDRVEVTKQRDVMYVYNGNTGYEVTYKGARAMEPKDLANYLRRRHYALDQVLRTWINDPKTALFYEGNANAADKPAEQVTVLNPQNEGVTLYFDINTHLPLKKAFTWRDPSDKERNNEEEIYDNYRPVQGVMTPYRITAFYNGDMSGQRFLNSVSYNKGLGDSMFDAKSISIKK
jgi:hypothetical protein